MCVRTLFKFYRWKQHIIVFSLTYLCYFCMFCYVIFFIYFKLGLTFCNLAQFLNSLNAYMFTGAKDGNWVKP